MANTHDSGSCVARLAGSSPVTRTNLQNNRHTIYKLNHYVLLQTEFNIYGDISKWGRLRALPVADEASNKEWQRSKFLHGSDKKFREPQQDITGLTRNIVGSVTHLSLKLRCLSAFTLCAYALSENRISQFSRNLVNWLCLYNFIWRRIEVVITGLTRNQLGSNPPRVRISPSPPRTP